jgi:iron complex outermembrane receptor protein
MNLHRLKPITLAIVSLFATGPLLAADVADEPAKELAGMTVRQARPTVAVQNPSPQAEVTGVQARQMNVVNTEDVVKYLPSLQIRKRYIGDRNAIIAARTTGTVQSARSLVYADGLLLSNLLGNSYGYPARWNLVGSEEIDTVDVLYGPFSAMLPGNSAGATILMTTRRPEEGVEVHARAQAFSSHFDLYNTKMTAHGHQEQGSGSVRSGNLSISMLATHLDSYGQPMSFATASKATSGSGGTPVSGYVIDKDPTGAERVIVGAYGMDHTVQNVGKVRVAYDFSPDTRLAFTFGEWRNDSESRADSYLKNAAGQAVTTATNSSAILINGQRYTLTAANFAPTSSNTVNRLFGLTFDSRIAQDWRVESAFSLYQTPTDISRSASNASASGGTATFGDDTGWNNVDLRAIWRPDGGKAGHTLTVGFHQDAYKFVSDQYSVSRWQDEESKTALTSANRGRTSTEALYIQDEWKFAPRFSLIAGVRQERWKATDGSIYSTTLGQNNFEDREESGTSPKLTLAWQATPDWNLRASLGKAFRFPTVTELFQTEKKGSTTSISDPNLKPEKVFAKDLTAEGAVGNGVLRISLFEEVVEDALYSFTDYTNTSRNQNVDKLRARGAEVAYVAPNVMRGLDLTASMTYVHSRVLENELSPETVGKWMVRVPDWRASLFAAYHIDDRWTASLGYKYSGKQYNNPDNSDEWPDTYGGNSSFSTFDAKVSYRVAKQVTAAFGVDNLTNEKYYAFHPYPQRTAHGEIRIDY